MAFIDYWKMIKEAVAINGSSAVSEVSYDEKKSVLLVNFTNGRVYEYSGVPKAEYEAILNAPSAGKYMNAEIVAPKKYPFKELI